VASPFPRQLSWVPLVSRAQPCGCA
jgi:hypothetical protein